MISIEWDEGTTAFWAELTDAQLDQIALFIEERFKRADSVGG